MWIFFLWMWHCCARLWAPVTMAYIFSAWVCAALYREYKAIMLMRLEFNDAQNRRPDQFTVSFDNFQTFWKALYGTSDYFLSNFLHAISISYVNFYCAIFIGFGYKYTSRSWWKCQSSCGTFLSSESSRLLPNTSGLLNKP